MDIKYDRKIKNFINIYNQDTHRVIYLLHISIQMSHYIGLGFRHHEENAYLQCIATLTF